MQPAQTNSLILSSAVDVAPEIREALEGGTLVLCVGPEPSRSAGLPGPTQAVRLLLERAHELDPSIDRGGLERWLDDGRGPEVLEQLQRSLGADYERELERLLSDQGRPLPPLVRSITRLRKHGLRAIYTLSLDRLLERGLSGRWPSFSAPRPDLSQRRSLLFKLRGTLEFPDSWVLSQEREQREFGPGGPRRALLEASFRAHHLLLLGFELGGTQLETLLGMLPTSVDGHGPTHFLVLPACDRLERQQLEARGLRVIVAESQALLDELAGHEDEQASEEPSAERNPYPGLSAFREPQAPFFFGRHAEVSEATARLGGLAGVDNRWLAIEGPSGVGKSSFAHAGLLPALRAGFAEGTPGRWRVACLRPGAAPLAHLAKAVSEALELPSTATVDQLKGDPSWLLSQAKRLGPGEGLLVLVDQLEELASTAPASERAPFASLLAKALGGRAIYLVTTIRSDFIPAFTRELPALASMLELAQRYTLPSISRVGLREAICEPAARFGVTFEPALVEQLLLDAEQGQRRAARDSRRTADGTLPLVAHILRSLWTAEYLADRVIALDEYLELGGITGALSRSADELVEALGDRPEVRDLFLRLIRLEPDGSATRRVLSLEEARVLSDERTLNVLSGAMAPREGGRSARLLVIRDGEDQEVELVHDALIRDWNRLSEWIEINKERLQAEEELARRAARWREQGSKRRELPRGADMKTLLDARTIGTSQEREQQSSFQLAMRRARQRRVAILGAIATFVLGLLIAIPMMVSRDEKSCSIDIDGGPKITEAVIISVGGVTKARAFPQTVIIYRCERNEELFSQTQPALPRDSQLAMIELPRALALTPLALALPRFDEELTLVVKTESEELYTFEGVRDGARLRFGDGRGGLPELEGPQREQLATLLGPLPGIQPPTTEPTEPQIDATPPSARAEGQASELGETRGSTETGSTETGEDETSEGETGAMETGSTETGGLESEAAPEPEPEPKPKPKKTKTKKAAPKPKPGATKKKKSGGARGRPGR